jgi:NSS family neurotransmitter:Na+ symporter
MSESLRSQPARSSPATRWSSPATFVLAAGGATIGFNNFWQFPAQLAKGGASFLLAYLAGVALIALPLLAVQLALGRRARAAPVVAFQRLAGERRADPHWPLLGWFCLLSCFLVLSYLSVFVGWTLAYTVRALLGAFAGQTADGLGSLFTALVRDPEKQLFWFTLCVIGVFAIVARGVRQGLESFARFAMAWLAVLFVFLLAFSATTPAFPQALAQMFTPGPGPLSLVRLFDALGQTFFSLLLGLGTMMMYGAYMPERVSPLRASLWIIALDIGSALILAVVTTALLASGGVEMASGPTLVFQALPLALDHLPLGTLVTPLFFAALLLAALQLALALAEPLVAGLMEDRGLPRRRAALVAGAGVWLGGGAMLLSFNYWAFSFSLFERAKSFGVFDVVQWLTSNLLLPLIGVMFALFAGWVMKPFWRRDDLGLRSRRERIVWMWLLRVAIPLCLIVLMFHLPEINA